MTTVKHFTIDEGKQIEVKYNDIFKYVILDNDDKHIIKLYNFETMYKKFMKEHNAVEITEESK